VVGLWRESVDSDACTVCGWWTDGLVDGGLRGGMAGAEWNGSEMDGCMRMEKGVGGIGGGTGGRRRGRGERGRGGEGGGG